MPRREESWVFERDGWEALASAQARGVRAVFIIPTNVQRRSDGSAVMGAGLAKEAAERVPGLAKRYGDALRAG